MKTYARLEGDVVAELVATGEDIATLFHPSLHWVEVTEGGAEVGWIRSGSGFAAPPAPVPAVPLAPRLADVLAEVAELRAQLARLQAAG